MSNPFDLLGNDVEDATVVLTPPKELVKKNTSSKKSDVPPPSANPTRANKNRPQPTGSDRAIKDKSAGRQQNKSKDTPAPGTKKPSQRKATDRHSKTGKVDTQKRVNRGWGDDNKELAAESQAAADATAELAADSEADAENSNKMSLQAYMQELSSNSLNKVAEVVKTAETLENAEVVVKEEEVLVEATKVKQVRSKQLKTKEFLNFDATFSDAVPEAKSNFGAKRGTRGGARGGARGGKNTGSQAPKNQPIDTKNLPSLA